jgi:hypothetical protein
MRIIAKGGQKNGKPGASRRRAATATGARATGSCAISATGASGRISLVRLETARLRLASFGAALFVCFGATRFALAFAVFTAGLFAPVRFVFALCRTFVISNYLWRANTLRCDRFHLRVRLPQPLRRNWASRAAAVHAAAGRGAADAPAGDSLDVARRRDPQNRPGAELIEPRVLPITVHHPDAALFAWDYLVLHFDMARHAYCGDIANVPATTRALYEPLWRDLGMKRVPKLGGFPRASVSAFSPEVRVMVLEVPSNQLMGWMFGDVDDLVLIMTQEQVAACRFGEAQYEASN